MNIKSINIYQYYYVACVYAGNTGRSDPLSSLALGRCWVKEDAEREELTRWPLLRQSGESRSFLDCLC